MTTFFEKWLAENDFTEPINGIFSDAVKCYKSGVYRAALMLSFVGMMNILRRRIVQSEKPSVGWDDGEWQKIQRNVTKDDSWEEEVLNAVNNKPEKRNNGSPKSPVFSITQDIRDQVVYWRNRRNDCAHYKNNHIDHYHVEGFWAFLRSNLNKLNIEGGMMSLFNKIVNHYDPNMTPPNADVAPLVLQIEHSVAEQEIDDFWLKLFPILDQPNGSCMFLDEKQAAIIETVFNNCNGYVKDSLIKLLVKATPVMVEFISEYPQRVVELGLSDEQIRHLWRVKLHNCAGRYPVICTLLNAGLIPINEVNELITHLVETMGTHYNIEPEYINRLNMYDFKDTFEKFHFDKSKFGSFSKTNGKFSLLGGYLKDNGFSPHTVEILCWEFARTYCSYSLYNYLIHIFENSVDRIAEFKKIAEENNITIPTKIEEILQPAENS